MSLKDKLNIKQATKTTSNKKSSIEEQLHKLIYSAIDKAIKESDFSQYYNDNLTIDTFVQDKANEVKLVEVRNARAITISPGIVFKSLDNIYLILLYILFMYFILLLCFLFT